MQFRSASKIYLRYSGTLLFAAILNVISPSFTYLESPSVEKLIESMPLDFNNSIPVSCRFLTSNVSNLLLNPKNWNRNGGAPTFNGFISHVWRYELFSSFSKYFSTVFWLVQGYEFGLGIPFIDFITNPIHWFVDLYKCTYEKRDRLKLEHSQHKTLTTI